MKFQVVWLPAAEQELAALWLDATRRAEVTRAAHAIDLRLQRGGPAEGESREQGWRILFELPLAAVFRAASSTRIEVVQVRLVKRRGTSA